MSERSQKLLLELRAKIDGGVVDRKIDVEVGDTLLGIVRELNCELANGKEYNSLELRGIRNEVHDLTKEMHELNRKMAKWR